MPLHEDSVAPGRGSDNRVLTRDLMRHRDPSLAANVPTDPKLLDMAGAKASLPALPLRMVDRSTIPTIAR